MPTQRELANAIRALAMDAVQKANSGHPGMPMGMADIATILWRDFLRFNPTNPNWPNRDRFILSNGHGAMLHYALLHLTGYDLTIDDIKNFRQLHSKTPGHPEYSDTPGVETTTGPLGQGLANGVGMAIAEQHLASQFNEDGHNIVDHYTYVFVGDGCMMEGISHEVSSLAGTLGLGKLIVFWDDNGISIDGKVDGWFTDNTPQRFESYNWHVIRNVDGHNYNDIYEAIKSAQTEKERPTLICCKTQIGFGSPNKANTAGSHGSPLGDEEIALTREQLNWEHAPFEIPAEIYADWDAKVRGADLESQWNNLFASYESTHSKKAGEYLRRIQGWLPDQWPQKTESFIKQMNANNKTMATRKASKECLEFLGKLLPEMVGGSADLTGSNCTAWSESKDISAHDFSGNYIKYGVREFGMSAIMNGMALHGGVLPYGGTFLTFADYARNAVRLSALMQQRVVYVYSHDSIGLGEDGPTHQPIEHAAMLRMTPGLRVWRPCDLVETAVAWQQAAQCPGPSCLLLTRQNVAAQNRSDEVLPKIARGGYVLGEYEGDLDGIIIATGSEVEIAIEAAQLLRKENLNIRVVSMPCCEIFKAQDDAYRFSVLPPHVKARIAVEAGVSDYWYQFVGDQGQVVGIDQFGYSAPAPEVYAELGITAEHVKEEMLGLLKNRQLSSV